MIDDVELQPGQNLRYHGKGFPGYVKGQPYMVFESYLNTYKIAVRYNNAKVMVDKRHATLVK